MIISSSSSLTTGIPGLFYSTLKPVAGLDCTALLLLSKAVFHVSFYLIKRTGVSTQSLNTIITPYITG